jgi:hypothetical protein
LLFQELDKKPSTERLQIRGDGFEVSTGSAAGHPARFYFQIHVSEPDSNHYPEHEFGCPFAIRISNSLIAGIQLPLQLPAKSANFLPKLPASFLRISYELPANVLPTSCQLPANFLPTSCQLPANFLPTSCQLPANFLQTSCKLPANFLQTSCKLPTNFLQTSCPLPVHFLQTSSKLRANCLHNRLPTAFKIDFRTKTTWKLLGSSQH